MNFLDYSYSSMNLIMYVIFLFIGLFVFVDGDCQFQTDNAIKIAKLTERGVYNRMYEEISF